MSARDVMISAGLPHYSEGGGMGLDERERRDVVESIVDASIPALTSSGYRILGPDEIDAVTVEKCAAIPEGKAAKVRDKGNITAMVVSAILSEIATAIRALCATHQGEVQE